MVSFLNRENGELLRQVHAELNATRHEVAKLQAEANAVQHTQDHSLRNTIVTGVFTVIVALVGGGALLATHEGPEPNQPTPISCTDERNKAHDMFERDGAWSPLPESSPAEVQCDINGYVRILHPPQQP